jgi:hypothetical protein
MSSKEKAVELVEKFKNKLLEGLVFTDDFNPELERKWFNRAKECAIICVNEIIELFEISFGYTGVMYDDFETGMITMNDKTLPETYWQSVKTEIQNLKFVSLFIPA